MAILSGEKRRIAGRVAVTVLLVLIGVAAAFAAVHTHCFTACAPAPDSFLKDHAARMRDEMARIHGGKVDAATLRKIEAEVVEMHRRATAAPDGAMNADAAQDNADPQLSSHITRYLATGPSPAHFIPASWTPSPWDQTAQNTPAVAKPAATPASAPASERFYVGRKACEGCHQQEASNWAHTIHAKVFGLHPRDSIEAQGCEACHGPGSEHLKNPGDFTAIISFSHNSRTPVPQQNAQCLSCHQGGARIFWHDSIHETNNLACSDCHNPMSNFAAHGLTARASINETCFQCHKIQQAQFRERSHMPLLEGKITCVDCHNPHGSTTAPLLKADSVNEVCYSCHADKRGPFLFEHAPVRESCLNCHSPHGSNFEALLTTPRPVLCQQCHSQDGHPAQLLTRGNLPRGPMPDPRLIAGSCQTCHVNIHGSNSPAGARFER